MTQKLNATQTIASVLSLLITLDKRFFITLLALALTIATTPPHATQVAPYVPAQHIPCEQPPSDNTRTELNGNALNQRTLWMLQLARALYHGPGDLLRVVQGSYVDSLAGSFGTHAGGGAVDISIRARATNKVVSGAEAARMVKALRQAGFAAWLRLKGDLKQFDGVHIHAIAIGDHELSNAARAQLDGPEGYFRGLDGVPPAEGGPKQDRYGGPIVCGWMAAFGFRDLR